MTLNTAPVSRRERPVAATSVVTGQTMTFRSCREAIKRLFPKRPATFERKVLPQLSMLLTGKGKHRGLTERERAKEHYLNHTWERLDQSAVPAPVEFTPPIPKRPTAFEGPVYPVSSRGTRFYFSIQARPGPLSFKNRPVLVATAWRYWDDRGLLQDNCDPDLAVEAAGVGLSRQSDSHFSIPDQYIRSLNHVKAAMIAQGFVWNTDLSTKFGFTVPECVR